MNNHASPFTAVVAAQVVESWRDDNGYGYEDSDYLTLSLKIPTWSDNKPLLARVPSDKNRAPPIAEGKFYDFQGFFYFKVPQKEWHQGYLLINSQKELSEGSDRLAGDPLFQLLCKASGMTSDNRVGLVWQCWDEYEAASYGQSIEAPWPMDKSVVENNLGKLWKFHGRLLSPTEISIRSIAMSE
ncbi:MAG: hypothetical protein Q9169_004860 [Polycauliona sp. 2 TL-2023]